MLFNMPELAGGGVFSSTGSSQVFKVIYSIIPPGLLYKDPPLSEGVQFTRNENLDRPARAPVFLDGFKEFFPPQLDNNVFLVLDIRTVRIDPPAKKGGPDGPVVTVEPAFSEKSFWTILPLGKEKSPGAGYCYVASGTFQLPLIRGPVPRADLFNTDNPLKELLARLSNKSKVPSPQALRLSDGASVIVRVFNPLMREVHKEFTSKAAEAPENIQIGFLRRVIEAGDGKIEKFSFDAAKFPLATSKTTAQLLPKEQDVRVLSKNINRVFAASTGVTD